MSKAGKIFKGFSKGELVAFIILMTLCFFLSVAIPLLLSSNTIFAIKATKTYKANELSDENLVSPITFSYIDEEETEARREKVANGVFPYYAYSYSASLAMSSKAGMVYDYLMYGTAISDESLSPVVTLLSSLRDSTRNGMYGAIVSETVNYFMKSGIFSNDDINYMISEGYTSLYVIKSDELPYTLKGLSVSVDDVFVEDDIESLAYRWIVLSYPDVETSEVQVLADIVNMIKEPNVFYDEVYTESMREKARDSVNPVVVSVNKGDYILRVDTLVTAEQLRTLNILNSKRVTKMSFSSFLPRIVISFCILWCWFFYSNKEVKYEYRRGQYTVISLSLLVLSLLLGFFLAWKTVGMGYTIFDSMMPILFIAMIGVSISNSIKYGMANVLSLGVMYILWPDSSFFSLVYYFLCGFIVCIFIRKSKGRFDTVSTCIKCAGILAAVTFFFSLLNTTSIYQLLFLCIGMSLNVIISFVLYSIVLPVLEKVCNIPTKQRLIELAYTDNATLTQLNQVAQGTYNHVKNVSDLAYNAAQAIGCNAELALVGARYHDIGKMTHPEYFVENQSDKNAHDQISSQLSSSIIKSHVRLGLEKGKEIGLPQEVLDIIGEHHGNDIIKYFYNEAVKNSGNKSTVVKEDFMYDGTPPTTKESAIVMIADCVEAATRTIKRPNHQKYEKFINTIIIEKVAHGQLDNSGLTMKDLKTIKEAFIPTLIGRDHHRISYSDDDED